MAMIQVEDLTFSYPSSLDTIFEHVSFRIDTDWKLGFVGRNGKGKTTFLNLLLGNYEYSGKITAPVAFDYFPYAVADKTKPTEDVLRQICPLAEDWELLRELSYLEVGTEVLTRPFQTLSNGEQTKVLLAALFLNEGRFLLIDEPTNHLDTNARALVSAYLRKKKGFILVSHDRRFLDGCVDHILSLNRTNIEVQSGTFSSWMANFEQQQAYELAENARLQKDIKRLQQAAKRTSSWSDRAEAGKRGVQASGLKADKGYVGHKAAKMMKRSTSIAARQEQAIEQKSALLKNLETAERLKLSPLTYGSETLLSLSEVAVYYRGTPICAPVSFTLRRGERIALDGRNGSGKSSLLKLVLGAPIEHSGTIHLGSQLVISYVPQDTSHLHGTLADFAEDARIDESLFKTILRKMDFERIQFKQDMQDFSAGQKKKVLLARSLCEQAHLYIWDEPLNFIDVYSRMQIEQLIEEFSPTMMFVEHDSAFRENIGTKFVQL